MAATLSEIRVKLFLLALFYLEMDIKSFLTYNVNIDVVWKNKDGCRRL